MTRRPGTPPPTGQRLPVAILGATGAVGQTFIRCLRDHPWFEIAELAASERSAGKRYADAVRWLEGEYPSELADRKVLACDPSQIRSPVVFSALDATAAGELEPAFARAGATVLSNAKSFRMEPDVPLVIPEVNGSHLSLLEKQRVTRGWPGGIVTNANCAATVATLALAPLHQAFGVRQVFAVTMQAVSGAGYPGVPSLDIVGNVIPYIADEEPKIEREIPKMLGCVDAGTLVAASIQVSAHANRVPVEHGHTVCMSIKLDTRATAEEALRVLSEWRGDAAVRGLPSAPERPLIVSDAPDRPQARRDVGSGGGMTVVVGRVRPDPQLDLRLVALGHNTIRGAAGGSVLNAELLVSTGGIPRT
ncbi:MAG: aspartate-semialdehyde dehydrogenase [Geminicoccaceae bacterium]|jgi:aspartate-semialdehyde dehydrogenase|nr:aspartate-semialdehyde dehydrogenase [Geminicoccaceae bacterium]